MLLMIKSKDMKILNCFPEDYIRNNFSLLVMLEGLTTQIEVLKTHLTDKEEYNKEIKEKKDSFISDLADNPKRKYYKQNLDIIIAAFQ
jgi:hypothetical protein